VTRPEWILIVANIVYATSYVTTRIALDDVGPSMLALIRLAVGAAVLMPLALTRGGDRPPPMSVGDRWRVVWMGVFGFAAAFALAHWGIARSTATNAALLITVEPISMILFAPLLLGERLTRREGAGAALALGGATVIVLNGLPGVTHALVPHWRGDLLLVLSGVAYGSYSLIGRDVLARRRPLEVTAWSIFWGALAMLPLAIMEWLAGPASRWTGTAIASTLYLALVITALGYLVWNYALERVSAPRAAIFLNLQPLVGALLGIVWLGERATVFTAAGGAMVVAGLALTVKQDAAR